MKPSVGRIVHVVAPKENPDSEEKHLAAIITGVNKDGTVNLQVFLDQSDMMMDLQKSTQFIKGVPESQWHWPERVE